MSSPKVTTKESDFSKGIETPATGIVGYVGAFQKGAIFERVRISNERQLVNIFGEPDSTNYKHFFTVQNFLNYANAIDVVRVVNDDDTTGANEPKNSGIALRDGTGVPDSKSDYIEDHENYTPTYDTDEELQIFAKDPGVWGDNLKIAIANYTDFATAEILSGITFASQFADNPEDTDEIAIAVIDNTKSNNSIVEKHIVSLTSGSKDANGNNNYIVDKINGNSAYIIAYLKSGTIDIESFIATSLSIGADGEIPDDGDITRGYDLFKDKENVDVNYLINGGNESDIVRKYLNTIAVSRKDIMAFIGAKQADIIGVTLNSTIVSNLTADITALALNSSYSAYFGNYIKIYDSYNDTYRWIGVTGEIMGLKVEVNTNNETWYAGAGFNRGILQNPQKLGFTPDETQRDTLYKSRINPIYQDTASGYVLLGQKTLLNSSSTFNRINVRELFIYVEKAISTFAREYLFEFNDVTTRSLFTNAVERFLRDIVARRGIVDFKVTCDDTNNTSTVIENNEFRADIAIKPNIVTEFITLNFFNVGLSIDFNEIL